MRILPNIHINGNFVNSTKSAYKNVDNSANMTNNLRSHKYTGNASVDLAYVSMFDNEIARDLKLMGLI